MQHQIYQLLLIISQLSSKHQLSRHFRRLLFSKLRSKTSHHNSVMTTLTNVSFQPHPSQNYHHRTTTVVLSTETSSVSSKKRMIIVLKLSNRGRHSRTLTVSWQNKWKQCEISTLTLKSTLTLQNLQKLMGSNYSTQLIIQCLMIRYLG